MSYFITAETTLTNLDPIAINEQYNNGFVFTRKDKGNMVQTRSLRVDLSSFEPNSENRRILNKNIGLELEFKNIPLENYSWEIHQMGKNFYSTKFGDMTMSASKIKEMFTDSEKSNMTNVFVYKDENKNIGYALTYSNDEILHYAYPFYDLDIPKEQSIGMAMMLKAIVFSKEKGHKYVYLGSVTDSTALYKLQFEGLEWWNSSDSKWDKDTKALKELILSL